MSTCDIQVSDIFEWNSECKKPVIVDQGGTSSGKTYNIIILLFCKAIEEPGIVITVVAQDVPALKAGALRYAEKILDSSPAFQQELASYHKTDRIFRFKNGSLLEFESFNGPDDAAAHGKREYLFINEAPGVSYAIYQQLALRTTKQIYIDYNPSEEFWVHQYLIPDKENVELFISDHRHNPFCDPAVRAKIEALKNEDIDLWKVYARGRTGKIEGLVYRNYELVERIPEEAELIAGALDFGFTNDPTAFLLVYRMNGELWIDELIYETGLTNMDIVQRLREYGITSNIEIIADCAEPKSIREISTEGFRLTAAIKGKDSIRTGIDILKRYKLNITNRSFGIKKELKSYKWKVDRDGKPLNEPVGFMNHSLDALRYMALNKLLHGSGGDGKYSWC